MPPRQAILYISYDGMFEPLGQSQVVAYLSRLAKDFDIHLMSFEKAADLHATARFTALRNQLDEAGIAWHPLRYHKSPTVPATLFDVAVGVAKGLSICRTHAVSTIHARSYVPTLIGLGLKRLTGARLLFDMRGLYPDERVDGGIWKRDGRIYRSVKSLEARLLAGADHIVTLTHASVSYLRTLPGIAGRKVAISVIPTCADLDRFAPPARRPNHGWTMGYVGSVGTWYLFDEVLKCFLLVREREPNARLLIVNRGEREYILSRLSEHLIAPGDCEIVAAAHAEVPALIGRMTVGAAIIKPVHSKLASAPTKLAEYLGCGVPCLGNAGVGDMEAILEDRRVGVALQGYDGAARRRAVDRLFDRLDDPTLAGRCRKVAQDLFSVEKGVEQYRDIYRDLAQ